jgi:hypothetical protein
VEDEYQLEYSVHGIFPIKSSNIVDNQVKILSTDTESGKSIIGINVMAESETDAKEKTLIELDKILDLYSLFTILNFEVLNNRVPTKISKKTGEVYEKKTSIKDGTLEVNFDISIFTNHLPDCWNTLSKPENAYIKLAVNFLKRARTKVQEENQIIDCFVAIESLFSTNEEKTEMRFRISNRVAILLAKDKDERIELRKKIRDLYDLRSTIVHGSSKIRKGRKGLLFIYVRESILRFLSLAQIYENQESIIDQIDDSMIDNEILKDLRKESATILEQIEAASTKEKPTIQGPKGGNKVISSS